MVSHCDGEMSADWYWTLAFKRGHQSKDWTRLFLVQYSPQFVVVASTRNEVFRTLGIQLVGFHSLMELPSAVCLDSNQCSANCSLPLICCLKIITGLTSSTSIECSRGPLWRNRQLRLSWTHLSITLLLHQDRSLLFGCWFIVWIKPLAWEWHLSALGLG